MPSLLGSGPSILSAFSKFHDSSLPHGGLADDVANSADAGAKTYRLLGTTLPATSTRPQPVDIIITCDDGPGPHPAPSLDALRGLVRPGSSHSTADAAKIGQAGIGSLSGPLTFGRTVVYCTRSEASAFVILVSEAYNEQRRGEWCAILALERHDDRWAGEGDDLEAFLRWSPFDSMDELDLVLKKTLPPTAGGLVRIISELRSTIRLARTDGTLDVHMPTRGEHPRSAREYLARAFPVDARSAAGRMRIEVGSIGQVGTLPPLQRWNPKKGLFHQHKALSFGYEREQGGGAKIATVRIGWSAREEGDSQNSGSAAHLKTTPHGLVVLYNGQAVVYYDKLLVLPRDGHSNVKTRMRDRLLGLLVLVEITPGVNLANQVRNLPPAMGLARPLSDAVRLPRRPPPSPSLTPSASLAVHLPCRACTSPTRSATTRTSSS